MGLIGPVAMLLSLALFAQSIFSLYLMLYTWEHPERLEASKGPTSFLQPRLSFTVLLPVRNEQAVIFETIKRVLHANYPATLLEVLVVCHEGDATIPEVRRAMRELGAANLRLETYAAAPINKPHGLNTGLQRSGNQVVTVFDAEDDIHADIFNVINTVMLEEETGIVQAGVQLMNFRDHWFGLHNCLEYFFWFKSRLHFHARVGMIPLGGNTVFIRRELLVGAGGWDEQCLTEDADIGVRLSLLGEPIRVVYDPEYVTREETPHSIGAFIRQRTRWQQGFLQILGKGAWRSLPRRGQRLLALYSFGYPLLQALLMLVWPLVIVTLLWLKLSVPVVMISFLPLYALGFQYLVSVVGAWRFTREYAMRFPLLAPVTLAITLLPFQWLLGVSAVRAVYRELRKQYNWEKTLHTGAHRRPVAAIAAFDRLLEEAAAHLGAERGSVLLLDPAAKRFSLVASRGLSHEVIAALDLDAGEGVAGWVARTGRTAILDGRVVPAELHARMEQPPLRSSVVTPIEGQDGLLAVVSIASTRADLGDAAAHWLDGRIQHHFPQRRGAPTLAHA